MLRAAASATVSFYSTTMTVVLRFVCVSAVLCGALGAPTVTYDQRQQGEYNLQVDLDDIGIVLMPGSGFAKKNVIGDMIMRHVMPGHIRNNGAVSKKKNKKPTTDCSTTTTEKPEVPYSESSPLNLPALPGNYEEELISSTSDLESSDTVPVLTTPGQTLELSAPAVDNRKYPEYDPYSVTPSTPNFAEKTFQSAAAAGNEKDVASNEKFDVRIAFPQPATVGDSANPEDMVTVKTVEKLPENAKTLDVKPTETVGFKDNPMSVSSDTKNIVTASPNNEMAVKIDLQMNAKTGDKSKDVSTVEKSKKPQEPAENTAATKIVNAEPSQAEKKPADEMTSPKTAVKPTGVESTDTATNTKKMSEPVEMVAMKTMEKPSFAEALKASKKPTDSTNSGGKSTTVVTDAGVMSSIDSSKKTTETIITKTAENMSSSAGRKDIVDKSGIMTSTKVVEILDDKKKTDETAVDSKSTPKVTEMIAVKTVENPTTVKNVISVKTMIKPTQTPKTALTSSSSITMRKVGDRKPLPSMTLEITPPKVTV